MRNLILIPVALIVLFSCVDWNPDRCEVENECTITLINHTDSDKIFAIQVEGYNEIYKYYGLRYSNIDNLPDTLILYNVPAGNSRFMLGSDVYQNSIETVFVIDSILNEFKTESCENYILEVDDIEKD